MTTNIGEKETEETETTRRKIQRNLQRLNLVGLHLHSTLVTTSHISRDMETIYSDRTEQ